jgi:OFA family oxalate/formate antiporter-like MFS transporter
MRDSSPGRIRSLLLDSGVYYGWFVAVGCFFLTFMTFGTIYSYTVFFGPILETFDESHANTSIIFSLMSLVAFGGAAILGFAIDRYGVRKLLVVAGVLLTSGLVAAGVVPSLIGVIIGYSVVAAAGLGIVFVVSYTTPPRWFDRRRGLATGIAVSGTGVGILVMPPLADALIRRIGWQQTYLVVAAMFLVAIVIAIVLLADRPRDLGVDVSDEFEDPSAEYRNDPNEARTVRTQVAETAEIVQTRLFGLVFVGLLLAFVPSYAVLIFLVEFTESVGVSRRIGVLAVSAAGALNIVAKFVAGGIADRAGAGRTMAICVGLMCAATVLLIAIPTPTTILVLAGLFGLGYGGIAALMSPLLADLFGTADLSTLFGVTAIGFAIGGTIVPYLVGIGFDLFGTYEIPFLAAAAAGVGAIVALLGVRILRPETSIGQS